MWVYASGHIRTDINNTAAHIYNTSSTQGQKYMRSLKKLEEETPFYGIGSLSHHCYQRGLHLGVGTSFSGYNSYVATMCCVIFSSHRPDS